MKKKLLTALLTFAVTYGTCASALAFAPKGVDVVSINDVPGIAIGNWTDQKNQTVRQLLPAPKKLGQSGVFPY
ncbi:MAG: hypothetical protein Q4D21_07745 [Phascolarctobacterium sp.]|nr:hypothetical protein [Phascolarctobacterium sp.]